MKSSIPFLFSILFISCITSKMKNNISNKIEVQGHRGCRGIMPENTIPAFFKAMDLGVNILELDVVISKDKQVVVSHEAYFNHELTESINGTILTKDNEKQFNIYKMDYAEITKIDVGIKYNPKYPQQEKIKCYKPLLSEVLTQCDAYARKNNYRLPRYNIEIKTENDKVEAYNPDTKSFSKLVIDVIKKCKINNRYNIQSFDNEILNESYKIDKNIPLAILIGDTLSYESHLKMLNFKPYAYSPYFKLVNKELVSKCKNNNILIIPWTVNELKDAKTLIDLNVDGIITDYPTMVLEALKK